MKKVKLGDFVYIVSGFAFDSKFFNEKNGMPLVRIRDVKKGFTETYTTEKYDEKYLVENDDILIGMDGEFNLEKWKSERAVLNQRVCKVIPRKDIDKDYIYFLLPKKLKEIENKTSFATVKHISVKQIENIEFYYITLEEQKIISNKLRIIQKIIDTRKKQIEELDELIKSQFVGMFDRENNEVELNDVCAFINGDRGKNYPSADKISKEIIGVPFINAGLLLNNSVDWENMNYISNETFNKLGAGKIQKDDILYCLRGSLGKHAIIDFEGNGAIASSLVILRCNKEKINPYFLLIQLDMDEIILQQNQANNGSSQPNLSANSVKKYKIKLPKMKLQNEFVDIVKQINKQKLEIQKSLDEMQHLQASLMYNYFG